MNIVLYPHPALRTKSVPVTKIDANLKRTVEEMFSLMYEAKGIGLAANQVGLPWRLFVINLTGDATKKEEEMVFLNPEIVKRSPATDEDEEGCLSIPDLYGPVTRSSKIIVDAFNLQGENFEVELDELAARAVQHEYDHIEGVMFTDRMSESNFRNVEGVLERFEQEHKRAQAAGHLKSDEELKVELKELASKQGG
ncbi:peptide deformylase [Lacunimicrobium album]|jgi:peptide deformylase